MKHSSHQIRGKCTYFFVLEPGITFHRSREGSGSRQQSPPVTGLSAGGGPRCGGGGEQPAPRPLLPPFGRARQSWLSPQWGGAERPDLASAARYGRRSY